MGENNGLARKEDGTRRILSGCAILFLLVAGFFFLVAVLPFLTPDTDGISLGRDKIAVVEVFGPIIESGEITKQIEKYSKENSIKGILIHLDTPGGGVAPSQEIYEAILKARKKKPVVSSMASVAASGGYYIAVATDKIVSNPGTITGSIGVIMGFMDPGGLMSKLGLTTITIKSGKFKDIGTPGRGFSEEDRVVMQEVINDVFEQFVEAISIGRSMKVEDVKKLADGRIFSGRMAKSNGMVDELGTFRDAVKILADMADIEGEPILVREEESLSFLKELLSEKLGILGELKKPDVLRPGLHFLWTGY